MTATPDYALMAGGAYITSRSPENRFPTPAGWQELEDLRRDLPSGFEAVTFKNAATGEIVISFAGTNNLNDWVANFSLATGFNAQQLREAAAYYLTVLTTVAGSNPGANITFTGHSLGGGLAALMGVFFDKKAVTFDQAPFANAATASVRDDLTSYLTTHGYTAAQLDTLVPALAGFTGLGQRAGNISGVSVDGEALSLKMVELLLGRIGIQNPPLPHGTYLGPLDLHAQSLLAAVKLNDGFRQAALKLPDFLKLLFDSTLYWKETDTSDANLLYQLLRHQIGVRDPVTNAVTLPADAMLDRFTADMQKLANTDGLAAAGDLTRALIAFAMQAYYEGPKAATIGAKLFKETGGGLQFLTSDVAESLDKMKGYESYFQNYLAGLDTHEWNLIQPKLTGLIDWYLAGRYLDATATDKAAFMLGAGLSDNLAGGTQNDVLVGGKGNDQLSGDNTWLDPQYHGNDDLDGGADDNRLAIYSVRHIDPAWPAEYPAGIPDPRRRGPSNSRNERELVVACAAAAGIAMGSGTMKFDAQVNPRRVSRGGTPSNEAWRLAA